MMTMPQRILIADDEETFRESTVEILAEAGYSCSAARDAAEAESLLENGYDLLLADVRMPGNAHLEFLENVSRRHPELPVLVITGGRIEVETQPEHGSTFTVVHPLERSGPGEGVCAPSAERKEQKDDDYAATHTHC